MINTVICAAVGANTGQGDCSLTLKNIIGGFLVPAAFELTEAQLASSDTALAALQAAVNADSPAARIYPLPETVTFTDNTEDLVTQTFGYGAAVPVRDGNYNITQQYTKGGNCMNNALQKFNSGNYRYIGYDSAGVLFGTKVGTSLKGIPLDFFYSAPFRFNDGSNVAVFAYTISFKPVYINSGLGFFSVDLAALADIQGLQNINLVAAAPRAAGVFQLKTMTGCAGTDLYDLYSVQIADPDNWVATQAGKNVTVSAVAANANLKAFTVTLDTTDPDYVAGQPVVFSLAPVSVLSAAGIEGFEGVPKSFA